MKKKYQDILVYLCTKHTKIYIVTYFLSLILYMVAILLFSSAITNITYPIWGECKQESGIVEGYLTEEDIASTGKGRTREIYVYYFVVDGLNIPVSASDIKTYTEGDVFEYYRYEFDDEVVGVKNKKSLPLGTLELLFCIVASIHFYVFVFTETSEREIAERKKLQNISLPEQMDYQKMTTKELFDLCVERKIKHINSIRKNREALIRHLKNWEKDQACRHDSAQKKLKEKDSKVLKLIIIAGVTYLANNYAKMLYYLLSLL